MTRLGNRYYSENLRFSGYRVHEGQKVRFFLPASVQSADQQVSVEYYFEGESPAKVRKQMLTPVYQALFNAGERIPKAVKAWFKPGEQAIRQWDQPQAEDWVPNEKGIFYRFRIQSPGKPDDIRLDATQTVHGFNVIPPRSADPSSLGANVQVVQDTVLTNDQLATLLRAWESGDKAHGMLTHFNTLGGNEAGFEAVLRDVIIRNGINSLDFRPFMGMGHHGYWTYSLFKLNETVSSRAALDQLALSALHIGAPMYFDATLGTEGVGGLHDTANMMYGINSPFLHWMDYGTLNQFPFSPMVRGILPEKTDPATGESLPNAAAWNIRVLEPRNQKNPERGYFIETYDPTLEDAQGRPKPVTGLRSNSQASIQKRQWPISGNVAAFREASRMLNTEQRARRIKELLLKESYGFDVSANDKSSYLWDGQRDQLKLKGDEAEVRDYTQRFGRFWTDSVDRLYTRDVASALMTARRQNSKGDWMPLVRAITKTKKEDPSLERVLPALNVGEDYPVSESSIRKALEVHRASKAKVSGHSAGQKLAGHLIHDFAIETLPAPSRSYLEIFLHTPRLRQLIQAEQPRWAKGVAMVVGPVFSVLQTLFPHSRFLQRIQSFLIPQSFSQIVQQKLDKALSPDLKAKLADPMLARLVYEELARSLYITLLTQKAFKPDTPMTQAVTEQVARSQAIPAHILQMTPNPGAERLYRLLKMRLEALDPKALGDMINPSLRNVLGNMTPEAAVVAQHVLHQRKLGLHWRIDAMKDIGDMDAVRSQPEGMKTARLQQELANRVQPVMTAFTAGIRAIFPASIIKPEVTDIHLLIDDADRQNGAVEKRLFQEILNWRTSDGRPMISGIPNFTWMFASPLKAVRMPARPMGEGEMQLTPAEFAQKKLLPMMQALPMEQALQFANAVATQDSQTALFGLTLHPHEAYSDYYDWWGLNHQDEGQNRGVFAQAINQLQSKPQLGFLFRPELTGARREKVLTPLLDRLYALSHSPAVTSTIEAAFKKRHLPPLSTFLSPDGAASQAPSAEEIQAMIGKIKQAHPQWDDTQVQFQLQKVLAPSKQAIVRPIPDEVRAVYADALFGTLKRDHQQLGLSDEHFGQLRKAVKTLMLEPSITRAMRGKLSNAFWELHAKPTPLAKALNRSRPEADRKAHALSDRQQAKTLLTTMAPHLDKALLDWGNTFSAPQDKRWLGYNQLDYAIDGMVEKLPSSVLEQLGPAKTALKQTLYTMAVRDALEQFKRVAAILVATPGDPSFYLADLFGQAGGEDLKNMYLGNRQAIRHDWVASNPEIARYVAELSAIIRQRHEVHVLNNGQLVLPLHPGEEGASDATHQAQRAILDQTPILPIIRDNGTDQAICLVNFGQPENAWDSWWSPRAQMSARYPELKSQIPLYEDYKLDLSFIGIPPGTRYRSVDAEGRGEIFIVDPQHRLVSLKKPQNGVRVHVARTLLRVKPEASA